MIGRVIIVAAVVVTATSVSAVVVPRQGHGAHFRVGAEAGEEHEATRTIRGASCGVERWPVKTLSDPRARDVVFAVRPATVRYLGSLRASPGGQDSRGPLESRVFGVQARLVGVKRESDSDYHLILSEAGPTMIAEMPLAACTSGAQHRYAMSTSRAELERAVGGPVGESWINPGLRVRVAGVLFFDFPHGQLGHARNYAELHPVTGFRVLSSGSRARKRLDEQVRVLGEDERRPDLQDVLVAASSAGHDAVVAQGVDHARRDLDHRYLLARRASTDG